MEQLPKSYQQFSEQFPDVIQAYSDLGKAVHQSGPLDRKTRELIKLGMAVARGSEGAVHSHTRRAGEAGASREEIYHVLLLAITSIGFSGSVAAYTWVNDVLQS